MNQRLRVPFPALLLGTVLTASAPTAAAGQSDQGSFTIISAGRSVGAERFRLCPDGEGSRFTSKVSYLGTPLVTLEVSVVYQPGENAFQLDRRRGETGGQVLAVQRRNRVTVRRISPSGEEAAELPSGPDVVLLADSVFSPYLRLISLAGTDPRSLKALFPESGRRLTFQVERRSGPGGTGSTIRLSGELEGEILLGAGGEVLRISLPAFGLEARRDPR